MPHTINHPEVDELAQELSQYTGESVTQPVINALRERLEREKEKVDETKQLKEDCCGLAGSVLLCRYWISVALTKY